MASSFGLRVGGWAAWLPGAETMAASAEARGEGRLPAGLRRRVTPIGRKALEAAMAVLPQEYAPRFVFCSRHGEYGRTLGLLDSLAEDGTVSPAEFSMSVHHALAGLLSIATGNRAGHTAVAAGRESLGYGLMEAAACLAEDSRPVLVVHFDEPLPEAYAGVAEGAEERPVALAVLLLPAAETAGEALVVETGPLAAAEAEDGQMALAFADFLASDKAEGGMRGERLVWRWRRGV